ncbi:MAG: cupin domain-containing protein [Proteobacteria bacterium]|nr:cupin domain-containing protein [Pseudomonadota bacterium]
MSQIQNAAAPAYPYAPHLNILFQQLETIDVPRMISEVKDRWYNQTLCKVNESVVRLGVMQGEYHWHKHDDDDEFFFCLDRTRAPERCVILMIENAGIVPTGD